MALRKLEMNSLEGGTFRQLTAGYNRWLICQDCFRNAEHPTSAPDHPCRLYSLLEIELKTLCISGCRIGVIALDCLF